MTDLIVIIILIAVLGSSISYIIKQKKKGAKCIGCSISGTCPKCTCKNK